MSSSPATPPQSAPGSPGRGPSPDATPGGAPSTKGQGSKISDALGFGGSGEGDSGARVPTPGTIPPREVKRAFGERLEGAEPLVDPAAAQKAAPPWVPASPTAAAATATVPVPAGEFLFGEERRTERLAAFEIDRDPVTNGEYEVFVLATGHRPPLYWKGPRCPDDLREHPVVGVDYFDAMAYARWAGKDLPYEDEWERAARGTDGRLYPWGDEPDLAANTARTGLRMTVPVGFFAKNVSPVGCRDLVGNAWELTHTPAPGGGVVVRGGSWFDFALYAKTTFRLASRPDSRNGTIGFRCVKRFAPRVALPRAVPEADIDAAIAARRGKGEVVDASRFSPERRDLVPDVRRLRQAANARDEDAAAERGPPPFAPNRPTIKRAFAGRVEPTAAPPSDFVAIPVARPPAPAPSPASAPAQAPAPAKTTPTRALPPAPPPAPVAFGARLDQSHGSTTAVPPPPPSASPPAATVPPPHRPAVPSAGPTSVFVPIPARTAPSVVPSPPAAPPGAPVRPLPPPPLRIIRTSPPFPEESAKPAATAPAAGTPSFPQSTVAAPRPAATPPPPPPMLSGPLPQGIPPTAAAGRSGPLPTAPFNPLAPAGPGAPPIPPRAAPAPVIASPTPPAPPAARTHDVLSPPPYARTHTSPTARGAATPATPYPSVPPAPATIPPPADHPASLRLALVVMAFLVAAVGIVVLLTKLAGSGRGGASGDEAVRLRLPPLVASARDHEVVSVTPLTEDGGTFADLGTGGALLVFAKLSGAAGIDTAQLAVDLHRRLRDRAGLRVALVVPAEGVSGATGPNSMGEALRRLGVTGDLLVVVDPAGDDGIAGRWRRSRWKVDQDNAAVLLEDGIEVLRVTPASYTAPLTRAQVAWLGRRADRDYAERAPEDVPPAPTAPMDGG